MFDVPATAVELADALVDVREREAMIGAEKLTLVAQWARVHNGDGVEGSTLPGAERAVSCGGDGTPKVSEFAAVELGALLGTTTHSARAMMADVLDLEHRHPALWVAVLAGRVPGWKAAHVARRCRAVELTRAQARFVDEATTEAMVALPWTRFLPLLEARIIEADPDSAEARRLEAATRRYFGTTRVDEHGLKTLYARHDAGDISHFAAVADRIAQILGLQGDDDPLDVRRAKAFGILADPARALRLLAEASSGAYGEAGESVEDSPELRAPEPKSAEPEETKPPQDLDTTLEALCGRSLMPRATLHIHLTPGCPVARVEGIGPVLLSQVRDWLRHRHVTIRPVLDLADGTPVDSYEVPARMREHIMQRWPFEAFPFGTLASRSADLDHVVPYIPPDVGGPPGQTRPDNLLPLSRLHHRAKTHANWKVRHAQPGIAHWRSPTGHWFEVDHGGTRHLGKTEPPVGLELVFSRLLQTHAVT